MLFGSVFLRFESVCAICPDGSIGLDIGPGAVAEYAKVIRYAEKYPDVALNCHGACCDLFRLIAATHSGAGTVVWNGPMVRCFFFI